ncbi:MAG TPA: HAD family acid phosphatase [Acidothermaceae bacterium]|jgi:hypothetical protein
MRRKLAAVAGAVAVFMTGAIGAASAVSATTVPNKSTWLAAASTALKGGTTYIDSKKHTAAKPAIVAVADGYKVLFATGRSADSGGTLEQLTKAGYHVDQLCFRDPKASSTQASKTACRAKWTAAGYGIIANIGNHTTDLAGGNSGKQYLLPNYGFLD